MGKKETMYRESLNRCLFLVRFEIKNKHRYLFCARHKFILHSYLPCLFYREWKKIQTPWINTASAREMQRLAKKNNVPYLVWFAKAN